MARSQGADFFHSMRFFVTATNSAGGPDVLQPGGIQAGFTTCSTPDISVAPVEYREGHYLYTRKYPGIPSMADISMSRGVAKRDSSFWLWLKSAIHGANEYRVGLTIYHFHKSDYAALPLADGTINALVDPSKFTASRKYNVFEAIPTHVKPASDLDANAGEVSVQQVDVAYEYFDIEEPA